MARAGTTTDEVVLRPGAGQDEQQAAPAESPGESPPEPQDVPLLDPAQSEGFLQRWSEVQARFVDDPRAAVQEGDDLVADLVQALSASFAQHKEGLEQQWRTGGEPGTEDLRRALQQYRSFFQRLLAT